MLNRLKDGNYYEIETGLVFTRDEVRAKIEAKRGIFRDSTGCIIRNEDWKRDRILFYEEKRKDFLNRIKNCEIESDLLREKLGFPKIYGKIEEKKISKKNFWFKLWNFIKVHFIGL